MSIEETESKSQEELIDSTDDESQSSSDTVNISGLSYDDLTKKRVECVSDLINLECQFSVLEAQLYKERVQEYETHFLQIVRGDTTHMRQSNSSLNEELGNRLFCAQLLMEKKLDVIENKFEAEKLAAEQNFNNEKILIADKIKEDLEKQLEKLEEERRTADTSWSNWKNFKRNAKARRYRKRAPRPTTVTGPYIVYQIKDEEINDDLNLIRKTLYASTHVS